MVAWLVTAKTPEYPRGRRFVIIANDITHQIGSFGPAEDKYFFKVTEYARRLGIPRIYLSANSGARIGIAEELIPLFSVAWKDPSQPAKGFDYLYLTEDVYRQLEEAGRNEVITERIVENGDVRHRITTIIGAQDGLGVECLRGSGLIAGATSRAYEDIFTITLVTCRSVGIGAYLVRLGQRAIQIEGQPIVYSICLKF
jgi:acetyl-CoA carboxylase / biotin carboxylase 1